MNNPYLFHPAMAPFTPRPCPPVPPPPARHPGLYEDMDGYTRKEIDDADARTLASAKGYADGTKVGKADLFDNPDSAPKIKSELLPSYVDDVLEYASLSDFPATGESGKIYIAKDTNKTYRWSGTQYVQVGGGGDVPITVVKRNGTALTPVDGAVDIEVPTGTAASKDVPASGDADENQVVLGNDSRLTDSRVPTQHYHSMDDISDLAFPNHKVWAATATGSGSLYTLTPFGNDFSLEEGCVIIYKCPADMGSAGVVYIKVGSVQHLLHWAKSGTQPTFSSVKSGDICIIQFRSDNGGWWALHGVNAYTAYQKPASGIPASDLASGVLPDVSGKASSSSLAPAFSSSSTYAVGDYVTHEGLLYKCTTAVSTAGSWNAANWSAVAVTDEMGADTPLPFDAEVDYVTIPVGAYVLPELETISAVVNMTAQIRFQTAPSSSAKFYIANFSGNISTSTQIHFIDSSTCRVYNGSSGYASPSIAGVVGQFGTVSIQGSAYDVGGATGSSEPNAGIRAPLDIGIGACPLASGGVDNSTITGVATDIASFTFRSGGAITRDMVPVRVGTVGYLYDKVSGRLFGSAVGSIPLVPGPDKAQPTITTPGRIVELTDSPAFTGTPTAPTAAAGTNTTQVATTAFVQSAIAALRSELGLT